MGSQPVLEMAESGAFFAPSLFSFFQRLSICSCEPYSLYIYIYRRNPFDFLLHFLFYRLSCLDWLNLRFSRFAISMPALSKMFTVMALGDRQPTLITANYSGFLSSSVRMGNIDVVYFLLPFPWCLWCFSQRPLFSFHHARAQSYEANIGHSWLILGVR